MARVYATVGDLADYPGGDAVDAATADRLLALASKVVDVLLRGYVYDVDDESLPTDTDVTAALRDATCAIALEADSAGVLEAGNTQEWGSVSIGNVSLSDPRGTETPTVYGVPVPLSARIALSDVGTLTVTVR